MWAISILTEKHYKSMPYKHGDYVKNYFLQILSLEDRLQKLIRTVNDCLHGIMKYIHD